MNLIDEKYQTMVTKETLLANLLDPDYKGRCLKEKEAEETLTFFEEYLNLLEFSGEERQEIRSKYQLFQSEEGLFGFPIHRKTIE